jgi:selenocysteine-specific elongation factor
VLGEIPAGGSGLAQLELEDALPARVGDRFVLRDVGRRLTAGGGRVLDVDPAPRPRGTEGRLTHALQLEAVAEAATDAERLVALVDAHGGVRERAPLRAAVGRPVDADAEVVEVAGHLVRPERLADWAEAVVGAAAAADPEHAVAAAELVGAARRRGCPPTLTAPVLERAVAAGRLVGHGGRYVHHAADEAYLAARAQRQQRVLEQLGAEPFNPPDPGEVAAAAAIPSFELQALVEDGRLVACGPLLFPAEVVAEAVALLRDGPGRDRAGFTAAEARDAWGTTRRAAVPLLEHLRATRVTEFDGSVHRLR